jgi:beta-glucanase (GH16 family)
MSDPRSSDFAGFRAGPEIGDVPRHRRKNPWARIWIGGGAALAVLVLAAAIGLVHAATGAKSTDAARTSGVATGQPKASEPGAGAGGTPSPAPKPAPKRSATKAPASKSPAAGRTTAAGLAGVPAPPAGFTLTWGDAFTGAAGSGLDRGTYRYATGPGSQFGTGEIETATDSTKNVFHDGQGHLVLRALHSGSDPSRGWTSGRFETQADTFGAAAGGVVRMQASIQQPDVTRANGAGYWPAFWMLGQGLRKGGHWPDIGEIDILEDVNGRGSLFGTLHCGVNPDGPCNEPSGIGSGERACAGCQTGFHTYAVEIDRKSSPERIRWFLDGTNYFTLAQNRVDATTWAHAVDHSFYLIVDLAMGGGFPGAFGGGPNAGTVSGGAMKVDYVAVYNRR